MIIEQCCTKLIFDRPLASRVKAKDLRGSVAALHMDNELFHQHTAEEQLVYSYPLIQYKIIEGQGIVMGVGPGAAVLAGVNLLDRVLTVGNQEYSVEEQEMHIGKVSLGVNDKPIRYEFLSPWLGLNTKNYREYQRTGSRKIRKALLERILVGNVISMSKGVGYNISERISASILSAAETHISLKDTPMLGFMASFSVNFLIPDYFGIGKSVSRGFGTIRRIARSEL
jgi:hypothetical protein